MARHESLANAITRMRREGWSEAAIRGQVKRWHPNVPLPSTLVPPPRRQPAPTPHRDTGFRSATLTPPPTPARPVGDPSVWRVQKQLNDAGYHVDMDGISGPQTRAAIKRYNTELPQRRADAQHEFANVVKTQFTERRPRVVDTRPIDISALPYTRASGGSALGKYQPYDPNALGNVPGLTPHRQYAPTPDLRTPSQVAIGDLADRTLGAVGHGLAQLPGLAEQQINQFTGGVSRLGSVRGAQVGASPEQQRAALLPLRVGKAAIAQGVVGPDLLNYMSGKPYSKTGLKIDLAMLPLIAGKPLRAGRVAAQVAVNLERMAHEGEVSLPVLRSMAKQLYHGPSLMQARAANAFIKQAQELDGKLVEQTIKRASLNKEHEIALRDYASSEQGVRDAVEAEKTAKGTEAKKLAGDEVKRAKEIRANAKSTENFVRAQHYMKTDPLPITDPRAVQREQLAKELMTRLKGQKNALPPGITKARAAGMFRFLDSMVGAGVWGRHWYEDSAKAIKEMFKLPDGSFDLKRAEKFAQLLAIYSPQQPIIGNTSLAIRASNEWWHAAEQALHEAETSKGGAGAINTGQQWQRDAAESVMQGKGDWDGRKTNNFYVNFLEDIDPVKFRRMVESGEIRPDGVTADLWMARVFGYKTDNVSDGRYDFMESVVRQLANERNANLAPGEQPWKPKQIQAAIWTAMKGMSDDVAANIDFAAGIERHFAQFNFETAPGTQNIFDDDFSVIYNNWPATAKQAFQTLNAHLVDDFIREVGLMAERGVSGAGVYATEEGVQFNPATATRFLTSAAPKPPALTKGRVRLYRAEGETLFTNDKKAIEQQALLGKVDFVDVLKQDAEKYASKAGYELPQDVVDAAKRFNLGYRLYEPERDHFNRVAAAIGQALRQDSVAWVRPFSSTVKAHEGTVHIDIGRVATSEEAQQLWRALNPEGDRGVVVMNTHDGFIVRNFSDLANTGSKKSPGFRQLIDSEVPQLFKDHDVTSTFLAADGELVESADYGVHLEVSDGSGPGADLRFKEASDRLAREADELRQRFTDASERFADTSGQVNPAAVRRELDRLQGLPWERVAVEDDLAATERWMQGIRPPISDEFGNPLQVRYASGGKQNVVPLEPGASFKFGRTKGRRVLRAGELEVEMPHARGRYGATRAIPHSIENVADWVSRQVDKTALTMHPNVWVLGTSGAGARALKQAGRMKRLEPHREAAKFGQEIRAIIQHKEGGVVDQAHYWYAQLPTAYRNADGLRLVRAKQQEFLDHIQSGAKMAELEAKKEEARQEMKALEEGEDQGSAPWWDAKGRLTILDEMMADLPSQQRNLLGQVRVLDDLIEKNPPADEQLLDSLRTLTSDREKTLTEAGRLADDAVDERPGLLANALGLEPDGSEIYMGHRMGKDPNAGFTRFLPSIGTGRVKSPPGMGENQLVLWETGRLRPSLRIGVEDWQHSAIFKQTTGMRNDIWKAAEPFNAHQREGYLKGKTIVNLKGRVIPAHWRTDELSQFGEGWDEIKDVRLWADEMIHGWAADTPELQTELLKAVKRGEVRHQDLRVIDNAKLERYAKQFRSSKGRATPGAIGDMLTDMVAASIVTFRIGFIPKNVLQNVITILPHQHAFVFRNMARAAQVWHDPELRDFFLAEAGGRGAISALGTEASKMRKTGQGIRWATGKMTEVADDPFRFAALLHEMAAEGVINNRMGLLGPSDKEKLLEYFTHKKHEGIRDQIFLRANNALPDFSRLTPDQSRILRRVAIIPGWLMAGSRWPFHFAATHPVRSALIAFMAMGEPGAPQELRFNEPVSHYLHGRRYLRGVDTPWGRLRTSSLDPVSTPWELLIAAKGSIEGKKSPFDYDTDTLWDKVAPGPATAVEWLRGEGSVDKTLSRLLPAKGVAEDMISPKASPSYPGDATRRGRLLRELGVVPIPVNDNPPKKKRKGRRKSGEMDFGGGGGGMDFGGGGGGMSFP